ncbi:hypothetical protein DWQ65_07635 [Treponema phagedenis]|uniref:Uncharacterized protein n=2 Tax=Treponema phagedenis TaxID=162 RepID=A0A0B7GT74_TREPH|nr:hypothetical protein [Treponema phagedenis]NVP24832.1 hypothetical protein [Treponema phagedenis]NVP25688.1 hypothetical protein [Treponema phagedenis]QEJ95978.1 hypothetical protein FUT79_12710 [Treponema phagedenis]QEJ98939.1 hypothetical protein FUT82_13680 [Treponema phagedenis]QEK01739.1 hypothetical protein FUT84_11615 [Treponema phagedenis]
MITSPFSWLILTFVGIFLLVIGYAVFSMFTKKAGQEKIPEYGKAGDPGFCPVCGKKLKKNERVQSAVYSDSDDKLCYIYGCPHCYPHTESNVERSCPVCHKKLGGESYLIARLFERKDESKHIHILGCPDCRFKK